MPLNLGIGDYARLGVAVFFVISGFLIKRLLGANAILALRCCQMNGRFEDYWESRAA